LGITALKRVQILQQGEGSPNQSSLQKFTFVCASLLFFSENNILSNSSVTTPSSRVPNVAYKVKSIITIENE
jgi:hypothetical protein